MSKPNGRSSGWCSAEIASGGCGIRFSARVRRRETLRIEFHSRQGLSLSTALAEQVDVGFPRQHKLEKADALVLAGHADAQQDEVVIEARFRDLAIGVLPIVGELLHGVLGVVVVPWNRVVI